MAERAEENTYPKVTSNLFECYQQGLMFCNLLFYKDLHDIPTEEEEVYNNHKQKHIKKDILF